MKEIKLTKGKFALVDDEDFEYINSFNWHAREGHNGCWYASRTDYSGTKPTTKNMHFYILGYLGADHIDRNGLNNQKRNLRPASIEQNMVNRKFPTSNQWNYRGIYKNKNKWKAQIVYNKKHYFLGYFVCPHDAARVYNEKAKELHGEFAVLNNV